MGQCAARKRLWAHFGTQKHTEERKKILAGDSTHTYTAMHRIGNCECALNGMEWSVIERRNKPHEL